MKLPQPTSHVYTCACRYTDLKKLLREVNALYEVDEILHYDQQCFMPAGGAASRAYQKAALAKVRLPSALRQTPLMSTELF